MYRKISKLVNMEKFLGASKVNQRPKGLNRNSYVNKILYKFSKIDDDLSEQIHCTVRYP
jgi:hypothetical protein